MSVEKKVLNKIAFLDLETQWIFQDFIPNYDDMPWNQKEIEREKVITKLKVSVAGVIFCNLSKKTETTKIYTEENINGLFNDLRAVELIVGHNLLRFDYRVLSYYAKDESLILDLEERTLDIMRRLEDSINQWTSLDDLGILNLGIAKTHKSIEIPKMWREGKHEEVIEHLKQDLMITKGIFEHVTKHKQIQYTEISYGKVKGIKSVSVDWDINNY
ncbi:MAG: hypothetical protein KAU62_13980 [Candidatus Heimdallarchaeota archaeon]|nr:hypothetical protein [Candidatus Heimdallarchaeota archaeon]MCK4612260.1 hypothetical protein [Candidatus Heimdallarchaeota archaeon]